MIRIKTTQSGQFLVNLEDLQHKTWGVDVIQYLCCQSTSFSMYKTKQESLSFAFTVSPWIFIARKGREHSFNSGSVTATIDEKIIKKSTEEKGELGYHTNDLKTRESDWVKVSIFYFVVTQEF